ncbi:MAG: hypothetical protein NTZ45_05090 [Methylococcales bacterium]|jgi:hypothetical protein|nr:hypothetical protein [Methylococcales bacterium]
MNRPTLYCLGALNLFFVGVLAIEVYLTTQPIDAAALTVQKKNVTALQEEATDLNLSDPSEDNYSDLVERPMFIKGRKPVEEPIPEEMALATAQKTENVNWELIGIYSTPKGTTAFFSRSNGRLPKDNFRKCKLGDALDGWHLSEINENAVSLTQGTETKKLPLRKMKPKNPTPTPVSPANATPVPVPEPQNVDATNLTVQPTTIDNQVPSSEPEDQSNQ